MPRKAAYQIVAAAKVTHVVCWMVHGLKKSSLHFAFVNSFFLFRKLSRFEMKHLIFLMDLP